MNYEETHALFAKGKEAWNAWANEMLAQKKAFEDAGTWAANQKKWEEEAKAVFSDRDQKHPFKDFVDFSHFIFPGDTRFTKVTFRQGAAFSEATFTQEVNFSGAIFTHEAYFYRTIFTQTAYFSYVTFECTTFFNNARFQYQADFTAMTAKSVFTIADAEFETHPPDFIQAHFLEAPRLDNIVMPAYAVMKQRTKAAKAAVEIPETPTTSHEDLLDRKEEKRRAFSRFAATDMAKWRVLQRMAEMGHDHPRKLDFFAREIISARHHPTTTWWQWGIGHVYEFLSNFGRSFLRPIFGLLLAIGLAGLFFIGQSPHVAAGRAKMAIIADSPENAIYLFHSWDVRKTPCTTWPPAPDKNIDPKRDTRPTYITGLSPEVADRTALGWEALSLALRNATVIGDWGSEIAHRTYGCLYGLERFGDTLAPILPLSVSFISALQKVWSALMLFFLGLALRNHLKMH
jgi:hypothetical protein